MIRQRLAFLVLVLLLVLVACQPAADPPELFEPLQEDRDQLTYGDLMAGNGAEDGPVKNYFLAPPAGPQKAEHVFEGSLTIREFEMAFQNHDDGLPASSHAYFPKVTVEFLSHESYLVPAVRDIVRGEGLDSYWNVIFSPGKIWTETGDEGYSRAAFPFVLVGDDYNEAHNGLATFLFNDREVSSLYLQITQETAAWHHTDFWGQTPVSYMPYPLKDHERLSLAFDEELARQNPIRPWSELESGRDDEVLALIGNDIDPADISASGIVKDGTIYLHDCNTRTGPFPYCRYMRHGVFSVTKSIGASVALLRLAQKYGEEVYDLELADFVDIQADHDGWLGVTFGDALNMASGVGDNQPQPVEPNVIHGDEGDDIVCAGPGNDAVHGARGDDFLFGEEGNDWLFGSQGKDSLYGGEGDRDVLFGGPKQDYLDGGPGERDVCLQQRDDAKVNLETCEVVFPPPGYSHETQHAYPPGIVPEATLGRRQGE